MQRGIGKLVGAGVKAARERRSLTQAQLAALTRKTVETVSNIERGVTVPSVQTLHTFSEVLGCGIGDFFTDVAPQNDGAPSSAIGAKLLLLTPDDVALVADFVEMLAQRNRSSR